MGKINGSKNKAVKMQIDELILEKRLNALRLYDREIKFIYLGRKEFYELLDTMENIAVHVNTETDQVFFYGIEVFRVFADSHIGAI